MARLAMAAACLSICTSAASADGAGQRGKIEDLFERSSDEHRFHMICLNGNKKVRELFHKAWLGDVDRAAEHLGKRPETFDANFLDELKSDAIANAEPDDDMTIGRQREMCDADEGWLDRLKFMRTILLVDETKKILEGG